MKGYSRKSDYEQCNAVILDKIDEWYRQKQKVRGIVTYGTYEQREDNLEKIESDDISKLEKIQMDIEAMCASLGYEVVFNENGVQLLKRELSNGPDNDEVGATSTSSQSFTSPEDISAKKEELNSVSREYEAVTNVLYGNEPEQKEAQTPEEQEEKRRGVVEVLKERKLDLMVRDASAKKILQEVVKVQAAKDALDMDMARHVVEKNKLMIEIVQTELTIYQELARGAKAGDPYLESLQNTLSSLSNQISALEANFEARRIGLVANFNAARAGLSDAKKEYEVECKGEGNKNHYTTNYTYSEDGVLQGASLEGKLDDKSVYEKELYDERGIMIFDTMDKISGSTSINIDGKIVNINSRYTGNGEEVDDKAYIDGMLVLQANAGGAQNQVEEMPDIDELNIEEEVNDEIVELSEGDREADETSYEIDGAIYDALMNIPMQERPIAIRALTALSLIERGAEGTIVRNPSLYALGAIIAARDVMHEIDPYLPQPGFPRRPYNA